MGTTPLTSNTSSIIQYTKNEKDEINIGLIVGVSIGSIAFIIMCFLLLYCLIKRHRRKDAPVKKNNDDENEFVTTSLIEELERKNRYATKASNKEADPGYVSLLINGEESSCGNYSNVFDDEPITVSAKTSKPNTVRNEKKPMPLPKPKHLISQDLDNKDSSIPILRKPMPCPRPGISRSNDNLQASSNVRDADNELYATGGLEAENEIYSDPTLEDRSHPTANTRQSTSAQLFNTVAEDDRQFASYVPVEDVVYKVPSNVVKFDPPRELPPTPSNTLDENYTSMNDIDDNDDYEIFDSTPADYVDVNRGADEPYTSLVTQNLNTSTYVTMGSSEQQSDIYENVNHINDERSDDEIII